MHRLSASHARRAAQRGFTVIEMVVVLAILGLLLALAVPRYLGYRKRAFKAEVTNILAELKSLSWAYYQEFDTFVGVTTSTVGFQMPGGSQWNEPTTANAVETGITWTATGRLAPLDVGDTCSVTLNGSGSSSQGCSF